MVEVLSLEPTPPANALVDAGGLGKPQAVYPLDVFFCEDCGHVQLLDVVDPRVLFEDYVYVSGTSPVFVKHFDDYAGAVVERFGVSTGDLVVDVGSNDGTLLSAFQRHGMRVLGIDPAREIARAATERGIETVPAFLTPALAEDVCERHGPAAVVTANNVFAHVDDLNGFLGAVRRLLHPDGVFVFEVSYLADVFEKTLFDTIYHEHLAYHSVKPLQRFFAANDMELIAVERVSSHGGSLRGMGQRSGARRGGDGSVTLAIEEEARLGIDKAEGLRAFGQRIDALKTELKSLLSELKGAGKRIAGFGAPAKATTLLYHFGIGPDVIDFIVDDSPLKQGLFSPGFHIPIVPSQVLYERKPDYVVVLAWNFAEPIMQAHRQFQDAGGHFIVPVPQVAVH